MARDGVNNPVAKIRKPTIPAVTAGRGAMYSSAVKGGLPKSTQMGGLSGTTKTPGIGKPRRPSY